MFMFRKCIRLCVSYSLKNCQSQQDPLDNCASPGLFISEFQLPSGLLIVHPGLGTAILCMVGHSNGAPGA